MRVCVAPLASAAPLEASTRPLYSLVLPKLLCVRTAGHCRWQGQAHAMQMNGIQNTLQQQGAGWQLGSGCDGRASRQSRRDLECRAWVSASGEESSTNFK